MVFHLHYKETESFLTASKRFDSTIDRRVNKLNVKLDEEDYGDGFKMAKDVSPRVHVGLRPRRVQIA